MSKELKTKIFLVVIPVICIVIICIIMAVSSKRVKKEDELSQNLESYTEDTIKDQNNDKKDPELMFTPGPVSDSEDSVTSELGEKTEPTPQSDLDNPEGKMSPEPNKDYNKISYDKDVQLKEMAYYFETGNQAAVDDLAYLDRYIAMSYSLKGTEDFYYYGTTNGLGQPEGLGIAVYSDNRYYYGEWLGGVRCGQGTFIHYHIFKYNNDLDLVKTHQYVGAFKADYPDGQGQEHFDYYYDKLASNQPYFSNCIGTYSKGLMDGEFYFTTVYKDESMKEWIGELASGKFIPVYDKADAKKRKPVLTDTHDEENYYWLSDKDNQNFGVKCYVSSK